MERLNYTAANLNIKGDKAPRVFRFAAVLVLTCVFLQPTSAFAEPEVTIIEESAAALNPAQQEVQVGSNDLENLISESQYVSSSSTPEFLPPAASGSDLAPGTIGYTLDDSINTTTPESDASTTPENLPQDSGAEGQSQTDGLTQPCQQEQAGNAGDFSILPLPEGGSQQEGNTDPNQDASTTPEGNASTTPESDASTTPESLSQPCGGNTNNTDPLATLSTGDEGTASTTINSTTTIEIINTNDLDVKTQSTTTANSGLNTLDAEGDLKNANLDTGDVNVYANVLTIGNLNLINSEIVEMNDTFNKLATDLYLNQPELSAGQRTQDLVSPLCTGDGMECKSITTFKLSNRNLADVENNVALVGNSGGNTMSANGDIKYNNINTGNVNAVVNVLNIVNANLINTRWTIVTFNVFGDWTGDLVMPSEMYFSDAMSVGTGQNSDISQVQKVILNVNNENTAEISNNVFANSDTGNNSVITQPDSGGFEGDIRDLEVITGNSTSHASAKNVTNLTVYNSKWFLGLVNVMGSWAGDVFSLPDSVAIQRQAKGFSFISASNASPDEQKALMEKLQEPAAGNAPAQSDTCEPETCTVPGDSETTVLLTNSNEANIKNNISVDAVSGQNALESTGGDIRYNSINTGKATALANILNFVNANLINADLHVGLVNIFGKWQGNVLFGYPDLEVSQTLAPSPLPAVSGTSVSAKLEYANSGTGSIDGAKLEWKFDPAAFKVNASDPVFPYQEAASGSLLFSLGKILPGQVGSITMELSSIKNLPGNSENQFFLRIFGTGPEKNLDNNQDLATLITASAAPDTGTPADPGSSGSGAGGSGSTGSGSLGGGSSSGGGGSSSSGGNSGGGSSAGGGGSSGASSGQQIGMYPNILRIYKSYHTSQSIKPGDTMIFVITLDNDGNNDIKNVVVTDTLKDSNGKTVNVQTFNAGDISARQQVKITYSFTLSPTVKPGIYTNYANAQGLNELLQTVHTQVTASSVFFITEGAGQAVGQNTGQGQNETIYLSEQEFPSKPETFINVSSKTPGVTVTADGRVSGETCVNLFFALNFKQGASHKDIKTVQQYLNANGFVLAKAGAGSPGKETAYFGPIMKAALTKFQQKNGIKEKGLLGKETRDKLNALLNPNNLPTCGSTSQQSAAPKVLTPKPQATAPGGLKMPQTGAGVTVETSVKVKANTGKKTTVSAKKPAVKLAPTAKAPENPAPAPTPKASIWSKLTGKLFGR